MAGPPFAELFAGPFGTIRPMRTSLLQHCLFAAGWGNFSPDLSLSRCQPTFCEKSGLGPESAFHLYLQKWEILSLRSVFVVKPLLTDPDNVTLWFFPSFKINNPCFLVFLFCYVAACRLDPFSCSRWGWKSPLEDSRFRQTKQPVNTNSLKHIPPETISLSE
jgi:hypothetical protein